MNKKIAIVTGAARLNGLGYNTALELGKQGYHVVATVRSEDAKSTVTKAFQAENVSADVVILDLLNQGSIDSFRTHIESSYGTADALINNAAINLDAHDGVPPSKVPLERFRKTFETNVLSVIAITQALLPSLSKSAFPRIVNVSSILGSLTTHSDPRSWMRDVKLPSYDMSKTALNSWTVELAWEFRDTAFKINSAHPGWVKTDMGGSDAPLEITDGIKTMIELATLDANGPTGSFFHLGETLPW